MTSFAASQRVLHALAGGTLFIRGSLSGECFQSFALYQVQQLQ